MPCVASSIAFLVAVASEIRSVNTLQKQTCGTLEFHHVVATVKNHFPLKYLLFFFMIGLEFRRGFQQATLGGQNLGTQGRQFL